MPTLTSHEARLVDDFKHQTPGAQAQILSSTLRDPKASGPLIIALRYAALAHPDYGYLQHGSGTAGPFPTERVRVKPAAYPRTGEWFAFYMGHWRLVRMQVNRLFITCKGERITILIEGV